MNTFYEEVHRATRLEDFWPLIEDNPKYKAEETVLKGMIAQRDKWGEPEEPMIRNMKTMCTTGRKRRKQGDQAYGSKGQRVSRGSSSTDNLIT